jgi:hypothetical protein
MRGCGWHWLFCDRHYLRLNPAIWEAIAATVGRIDRDAHRKIQKNRLVENRIDQAKLGRSDAAPLHDLAEPHRAAPNRQC